MTDDYKEISEEDKDKNIDGVMSVGVLVAAATVSKEETGELPVIIFKFCRENGDMLPAICLVLGDQELDDLAEAVAGATQDVKELR